MEVIEKWKRIRVYDIIYDRYAAYDVEAETVFTHVSAGFLSGHHVELSFEDVVSVTHSFLNGLVGRLWENRPDYMGYRNYMIAGWLKYEDIHQLPTFKKNLNEIMGKLNAPVEILAAFCEHANEVPIECNCPDNCYCKSHTCKNKNHENERGNY